MPQLEQMVNEPRDADAVVASSAGCQQVGRTRIKIDRNSEIDPGKLALNLIGSCNDNYSRQLLLTDKIDRVNNR